MDIITLQLNKDQTQYKCQIQIYKKLLYVTLYLEDLLKWEGIISLAKIQTQIYTFLDYNIKETYAEIKKLGTDKFKLENKDNILELNIEFTILDRKNYLVVNLYKTENEEESEINIKKKNLFEKISEFEEIIQIKNKRIKELEEELKKYKILSNDNINNETSNNMSDNNFNIKMKDPIYKLKYHEGEITWATILKDGRFATTSLDRKIIIYNKSTFKPDLIIKEHDYIVWYVTQLNSGILVSCSNDYKIKLYNINSNNYTVLQTLNFHSNQVYKVIELSNQKLASCSSDHSIIFYHKNNSNQYIMENKISTGGSCWNIYQTKDNELCYWENTNKTMCFYDLSQSKIIIKINNISSSGFDNFQIIKRDLLAVGGKNIITIININNYSVVRKIDSLNSDYINALCLLNENILLTGDNNGFIIQWKIDGDNLILTSKKENAHENKIQTVIKFGNDKIISGDHDGVIKIW